MLGKFPVGKERHAVGQLTASEPVEIKIKYDDIDLVKQLRVKFWGSKGQSFERDIDVAETIQLSFSEDELGAARIIDASIYTVSAVLEDDEERLITKGRVWLSDTN